MRTRPTLRPVAAASALALGLGLAGPAAAVNIDFSGSNIYMKFLDGDQILSSPSSGDTESGADQGQWTEFELRMKVQISKQVEAGIRLQSRSPAGYWTSFGFANNEGFGGPNDQIYPQQSKFIKLRGAYVLLTPGYNWLDQALIGSSDWGMFDPFTIGQVRYIDRDNYNGLYFKGGLPFEGTSWEVARLSLPNYLQSNYGQGPTCCETDASQYNEAVWIAQLKAQLGGARFAASYQWFDDNKRVDPDGNPNNGADLETFSENRVFMLKGEGNVLDIVDLKGAFYRSTYEAPLFDQPWINSPKSSIDDNAFKIDVGFNSLPVPGLTFNYQYFDIGAGFYSNTASRRETDVLLTEGSESAWYSWGKSIWLGGAARDYQQSPSSPKCRTGGSGGRCSTDSGLAAGANGLVDNDFMDFDEAPAESVVGWKGHTFLVNWEVAQIPLGFEYTRVDYNYNWQNYSPTGPLSNWFALNNDRSTDIIVAKAGYVLPFAGGIELGFKYKRVDDTNGGNTSNATDDRDTLDDGWTISAGNQLFGDLYGRISYGSYSREITTPGTVFDNEKSITSLLFAYNLAGFETGILAQWVRGDGDPGETGQRLDISQYRMKAFVKAIF
ncbi:MAG: hypothetical protein MUF03_04380 [Rubrivivax sp.]|jgi:hypothetical protein|nr:hypothetical protein [Rubrivivax sp.]